MLAGGLTAWRIHGIFGSENRPSYADTGNDKAPPVDPKHLTYEVFGSPGTVAGISYFDVNAQPQQVTDARLPWSVSLEFTSPAVIGNIMAQGDHNNIGCRILVDGKVKDERISHEVDAFTYCLLKAA